MPSDQLELWEGSDSEPVKETYPAAYLSRPESAPFLKNIRIEALKGIDNI